MKEPKGEFCFFAIEEQEEKTMEEIKITRATTLKEKPDSSTLVFGKSMTDHMFIADYDEGQGWHDPRIVPYGPLHIDPAAKVLHYAEEIFEGLKAYRTADGSIQLFRPDCNIQRMNDSAERMCLPKIPEDLALAGITELVKLEQDWVPSEKDTSLYIRPFMIGLDAALGVHASHHCQYIVIVCPVGAYYPEGLDPVKIYVEDQDVRAVKGGTGMAKTGGNYAASLRAGDRAEKCGYSQVLWLDGVHRKYIEEVGSMNVMFKVNGKILTPDLNGSVLPGITRRSCIQLLKDWGYEVEERRISAEELFEAAEKGTLEEAWGTGTAAVVSPIGELAMGDKKVTVSNNQIGPVTQKLYDELTGIQWGRVADPHNWVVKL
jgi:branched-chain amino acid aminotransferase